MTKEDIKMTKEDIKMTKEDIKMHNKKRKHSLIIDLKFCFLIKTNIKYDILLF
jgi:hypothetical protein